MLEERHEIIEFSPDIPLKVFMHKLGYVGKHWHKSMELLMVLQGAIEITVDGKVSHLETEDIIVINSNSIHEIRSEGAVMIAVQIELSKFNHLRMDLESYIFDCNSSKDKDTSHFSGLRFCIASMITENTHHKKGCEYRNYSLSYYLISELVRYFQVPVTESVLLRQKHLPRLTRILKYINDNYAKNFTLRDLAESEQLSVPYLSNFFDKYMGIKFSQYYTNVKLDHAANDLANTTDTIETIAMRNGFTESHAFVRAFKKRYNTLPSTWRKNRKAPEKSGESPQNLNYLLLEPSNYLNLLTKYTTGGIRTYDTQPEPSRETYTVPPINVQTTVSRLRHTFKKSIGVGRASELLQKGIQDMLKDLQANVGYEFIKFHGILSDDMMVVSRVHGQLKFHYTLVDMVLDFILSIGLKPIIQLSFMPLELASDPEKTTCAMPFNTSPPKKMEEWDALICDFTFHLIQRYGYAQVIRWLFCVWNEPTTPPSMFGFGPGKEKEFFEFYEHTFKAVKKICPQITFGTPSLLYIENLGEETWITRFLQYTKDHDCAPQFLNVHYYSDILPSTDTNISLNATSSFPKRTDDFSLWIGSIKKIFKSCGFGHLPIYLTEWNFTLSHRNLINDTCFKSCWLMKNLLKNYDRLDAFGYWSLTDLISENALPDTLFHGGLGLYTMNGLRKNAFYVFYFANHLGNELLASGDGYFVTKRKDGYAIITYNYIHYGSLFASGELFDITETNRYSPFDMSRKLKISFTLENVESGSYQVREYFVNRDYGSAFDLWLKMGALPLNPADTDLLQGLCVPGFHMERRLTNKNILTYTAVLEPLEIRLTLLTKTELA